MMMSAPPRLAQNDGRCGMVASVQELTKQSGFIFEGTVGRISAVTTPGIEATPATVVVHVDKVLKGPDVLSGFAGREITIVLGEHESVSPGTRAVFFTNGLHYGEGLVVREVGRLHATGAQVEREVREAMKQVDDEDLLQRLRDARLVVSGVVINVRPHDRLLLVGTEHDPEWWKCVIDVEAIEKGTVKSEKGKSGKTLLTAFFAHSADVAWYRSPKLEVGDQGVFILHEAEFRTGPTPGPAIIHPLDFRPMSTVEQIRALIKRIAQ
jgi:hypothetical protein